MEMQFVAVQDLYTEKDSLYVQTPENSSIPPPSSKTVPRLQSRKHPLAQTNKRPLIGTYGDVPPPKRQIEDDPRLIQLLKMPVYVLDQLEPGSSEEVLNSLVMVNEAADESFQLGLVDPRLLARIAELEKSLLSFGPQELTQARYKANPLEGIGSMMFINRAAMKLVCLDAHFKFTNLDHVYLQNDKIYRFADLGGGPGGFAEYLLWRPFSFGGKSAGWGITKRGDYEYQVENFHPSLQPNPKFSILYGEDGTGNLCSAANIRFFTNQVLQATENIGVDIVTADGLADSPNPLSQKNEDFRQFLTAQVLNMLIILREGGTFILKLHDIHSPFTLGLIWLLYRHFDKICLAKPVTSRPANSEKYLLGHRLTRPSPEVVEHLYSVLHQLQTQPQSVVSLVDLEPVMKDEKFLTYIRNMISRLCIQQHDALEDLVKFCKDPMLPQRVPNFPVKGLASRVWCIQKERYHRNDMSEMRMHPARPHHYNRYDPYPKDSMRGGGRKAYSRPPY